MFSAMRRARPRDAYLVEAASRSDSSYATNAPLSPLESPAIPEAHLRPSTTIAHTGLG